MLYVTRTPLQDADCMAVRRGRDVVLLVAEHLISVRGAVALTAAIAALDKSADLIEAIGRIT